MRRSCIVAAWASLSIPVVQWVENMVIVLSRIPLTVARPKGVCPQLMAARAAMASWGKRANVASVGGAVVSDASH